MTPTQVKRNKTRNPCVNIFYMTEKKGIRSLDARQENWLFKRKNDDRGRSLTFFLHIFAVLFLIMLTYLFCKKK